MMTLPEGQDAIIQQPDAMAHGLAAYNSLSTPQAHPVETIQKLHFKRDQQLKEDMAHHIYGKHFVEGLQYEQMTIAKLHAQGYNSSQHSLEISLGLQNTIRPEDYMSLPRHQGQLSRTTTQTVMQQTHDAIGQ